MEGQTLKEGSMNYCTVKPSEEYTVVIDGITVGLWTTYNYDLDLWNLVTRIALEMMQYEPEFIDIIPDGKKAAGLFRDDTLIAALDQVVKDDFTLREILRTTTPQEMFDIFQVTDTSHLKLNEFFRIRPEDTIKELTGGLLFSTYLRTLQYKKHFRGKTGRSGRVIQASFRSNLDSTEAAYLKIHSSALLQGYKRGFGLC